jgi:arsenite methyltransferase
VAAARRAGQLSRLSAVSDVIQYDREPAQRIRGLSQTPAMHWQRERVIELLAPRKGERILDLGCGPGHLARELAAAVGPEGRVCGADVSEQMLELASDPSVELEHLDGTTLPFADAAFDAAVATQVYEYVEELPVALAELHRVLRSGGRALILDTDWDAIVWRSSDDARMQRVLDGWRRRLADPHLPRTLDAHLREAGFEVSACEPLVILDRSGEEGSYSISQIEHLGASGSGVAQEEIDAWGADLRELARTGQYFFSLNRYLFLAARP